MHQIIITVKRILERLGIQTSLSFSKFDRSEFVNLKDFLKNFWLLSGWVFDLETKY